MSTLINGLHHVTTIAGDAQRNVDFYTDILGLRLVKKTINFDAPDVYHLYYGDETGSPGTILTFFPYGRIPRGRKGAGQLTYTAFSVPTASLSYWIDRLNTYSIAFAGPYKRFNETYIRFDDFDGMGIELVANDDDLRTGWATGPVPAQFAIRGFHTVTLNEANPDATIKLLTESMDHRLVAEEAGRFRFVAGPSVAAGSGSGSFVDVQHAAGELRGAQGAGSVHHVAFATDNHQTQVAIRERLIDNGFMPTEILDRNYFKSIYYREPGGVLFEIATNPPGFAIDEPVASLGRELKLPEWYEPRRAQIEAGLPPISVK
ncbi:ring-cleaving dioxygenase [Rudanella paleaurantiibacter]|uniref:Ring-cleaving dioxygenase n=1 Tax=Rudanella paleaurantiibacter TaxID=2614655 RepID=A0A7J5U2T8_9BACT|nr:ring-cleaving dioxygenase [Rudanella paleaurantiibacter]KAB7732119.1 ring-cleaving dioxygenase [Rudanella paleaurantiibacter]